MSKEEWAAILGHQLKGIMLHSDLFGRYILLKDKADACKHYCRALKETECFMKTNEYVIGALGEILEPAQQQRVAIPKDATSAAMKSIWLNWEADTAKLYHDAMEKEPDCKLLQKLYRETIREMTTL